MAASHGHLEIVNRLIDLGANIHASNELALRLAVSNGKLYVVKYLIESGADIHWKNDIILRSAIRIGYIDIVKILIEYGANINDTALKCAEMDNRVEITKVLKLSEFIKWHIIKILIDTVL